MAASLTYILQLATVSAHVDHKIRFPLILYLKSLPLQCIKIYAFRFWMDEGVGRTTVNSVRDMKLNKFTGECLSGAY